MTLMQDEVVVEALAPDAAEKAFADRISARSPHRCPQHLDATPRHDAGELSPELTIVGEH